MLNRVISGKSPILWKVSGLVLAAAALAGTSCGGSKKRIVVGSKSTTAQVLLGEILAQHLEHRLGRKVDRRLSLGTTALAYQSMVNGEIGLYPEETGTALTGILKESASADPASALERVRNEMRRTAQTAVLDPLGIDNAWAVVVSGGVFETLTDAEHATTGWKLGINRDFNERRDGLSTLNQYRLPMGAMTRVSDAGSLYAALESGEITMVVGNSIDGQLDRHRQWKVLRDDRKVFPAYQTCVMVRTDVLLDDPKIQPALAELSGRFTNEIMRKLNAEVDVDRKSPEAVAAGFLAQAGLK